MAAGSSGSVGALRALRFGGLGTSKRRRRCASVLLAGAIGLLSLLGARASLADCCECTAQFGSGKFCAPTSTVQCGMVIADTVDCSATTAPVVVGGVCEGGTGTGAPAGIDATCVPPAGPVAPALGRPTSVPFAVAAIALLAGGVLLLRRSVSRRKS